MWKAEKTEILGKHCVTNGVTSYFSGNSFEANSLANLLNKIEETAKQSCWSDNEDFEVDSYGGGNFDDCFAGGLIEGEVQFARDLSEMY